MKKLLRVPAISIIALIAFAACQSETGDGKSGCRDDDGDGYGARCSAGTDCDDANPNLNCSEMALIPAGCFDMGDHFTEGEPDERPVHQVCFSKDFYVDKYETTNAQYKSCVDAGVCEEPLFKTSNSRQSYFGDPAFDNYPVIYINWNDSKTYCEWAGKRLLTEAEWEYAARGGVAAERFPWGEKISCAEANYSSEATSTYDVEGATGVCVGDAAEVGGYEPNGYGLYDMAGNVWEWVNDWYDENYYSESGESSADPQGPSSGELRCMRGASFYHTPFDVRVANRGKGTPDHRWINNGVRCAY